MCFGLSCGSMASSLTNATFGIEAERRCRAGSKEGNFVATAAPALRPSVSSDKTSFTARYQDILYTFDLCAQRSTAVDRWAQRSISRTRDLQK